MRTRFGALERIVRSQWRPTILRALRAAGGIVPDAAHALGLTPMQLIDLLREDGPDARKQRLRRLSALVKDEPDSPRPSVSMLRSLRDRTSLPSVPPSR